MGFHYSFRSWHGWGWEGQCRVFGWRCWPWSYTFVHLSVLASFFSSRSFSASLWLAQSAFFHSFLPRLFFPSLAQSITNHRFVDEAGKKLFPPLFFPSLNEWLHLDSLASHQSIIKSPNKRRPLRPKVPRRRRNTVAASCQKQAVFF